MKGTVKPAPRLRLVRLITPTARLGSATEKLASMPCSSTVSAGGSEKPSSGIRSRSASTNESTPMKWMPEKPTSTSVLSEESAVNSIFSKSSWMKPASPSRMRSKWVSAQRTLAVGAPPLFFTLASTATTKPLGSLGLNSVAQRRQRVAGEPVARARAWA